MKFILLLVFIFLNYLSANTAIINILEKYQVSNNHKHESEICKNSLVNCKTELSKIDKVFTTYKCKKCNHIFEKTTSKNTRAKG